MEKITATYDKDSKRYYRFIIDEGQGVVGNIYIPKGQDIHDEITISLRTPGEKSEHLYVIGSNYIHACGNDGRV